MKTTQAELVFVPTPGMGHLLSTVELAKLIVHRDKRISVLILIINIPSMSTSMTNSFVDSQSRDNPYPTRLTFVTLPPLANPPESNTISSFQTFISLHKLLVKQAVEDRIKAGLLSGLAGFVLDMFCAVMIDVSVDFTVPSYIFCPSGANYMNLSYHIQELEDDHGVDIITHFSDPDIEYEVPGFVNPLKSKYFPATFLKQTGASIFLNLSRNFKKSNGIIVNTFMELESFGLQTLLDQVAKRSTPAIYPVGPILELDRKIQGGFQKETQESIIQWLDDQPSSSVVFLCFGSMGSFDAVQVKEIAHGLEKSGHRFLWSLRKPPSEGKIAIPSELDTYVEALPEGFLDRTAERGKIIGWAPQVAILRHPAVGGFVSHCGWNSTLESVWFGIPVATWPLGAEQQLNAFQLVKELGLAVEIRMDYQFDYWTSKIGNFVVTAKEIEDGVKKLMSMDEETKNRVREMSDNSRKTLEDGGSSHKWLGRFIEDVLSNVA